MQAALPAHDCSQMRSTQSQPRTPIAFTAFCCALWHLATLLVFGGCASSPTPSATDLRAFDPTEAERLAIEAGRLIDADPKAAEALLQRAILLDPHCGVAHNNLGTLQFSGKASAMEPDLFAAAESFQTAARLLPGRADPRVNYGLVMERAGRHDDALAAYSSAVESAPSHLGAVQALTSLEIRTGRLTGQTRERLKTIASQGTDTTWRTWARDKLLRAGDQ